MSLITHFLAADVRRLRWIIAGWTAVTATVTTFQAMAPFIDASREAARFVDLAATLGWLTQILVAAALLPLVIQIHPAVGTTAFWMTRPFPRLSLAASKLVLLAVLFLGVPAVCDAAVMAFYRVPSKTLIAALSEASLQRAAIVVFLAAIASLTSSYGRFLLLLSGIIATIIVAVNIWLVIVMSRSEATLTGVVLSTGSQVWAPYGAPAPMPGVAMLIVATLAGACLIAVQYWRRSRPRTIAVAAVATVVVASMGMAWPPERPRRVSPQWANDPSKGRLVAVDSAVSVDGGYRSSVQFGSTVGRANVLLENVPSGWLTATRLRSAALHLDDGRQIISDGYGFGASLAETADRRNPVQEELRTLLDVDRLSGFAADKGEYAILMALRRDQLPGPGVGGRYRGEFAIDLVRISIAAVLPLEKNAMYQAGAYRLIIDDARFSEMGPRVRVRVSDASPMFDSSPGRSYFYYLRNPSRREALTANEMHWGPRGFGSTVLPFGGGAVSLSGLLPFSARSEDMLFASYVSGFEDISVDEAWTRGAHLVLVRVEHAGTIDRTLEIPRVRFVAQERDQ